MTPILRNKFLTSANAFAKSDVAEKIIISCGLTPVSQDSWRKWTDRQGHLLSLQNSPNIQFKRNIYDRKNLNISDLYFFRPIKDILSITERILIIPGFNEDEIISSLIIYTLCNDGRLRLLLINDCEYLGQVPPLYLGIKLPIIICEGGHDNFYDLPPLFKSPLPTTFHKALLCKWPVSVELYKECSMIFGYLEWVISETA